jgi:hypothetical protein
MENQDRNLASGALHGGLPLKSYIKTILGKVYITVWDSFENVPVGMLLEGDPRRGDETSIIDIWSEEEDFFFKNKNKVHLTQGNVIVYQRKNEVKERTVEEYSDEELKTIINSKFFTLQNVLNNTESVAVLFRIKNLAQEMEKSDKLVKAIEARISEVQAEEFKPLPKSINMEL